MGVSCVHCGTWAKSGDDGLDQMHYLFKTMAYKLYSIAYLHIENTTQEGFDEG